MGLIENVFAKLGYVPRPKNEKAAASFALYSYKKADGSFDYEGYRKIQEEGNIRKIESVWVREENIEFLANYLKGAVTPIRFGICHGTRRGKEQEWFRKYLGAEVIGTEISSTATTFPHTIQWDFHEVKPEWINAVDFRGLPETQKSAERNRPKK